MTKLKAYAGICGFTTTIEVDGQGSYEALLKIKLKSFIYSDQSHDQCVLI